MCISTVLQLLQHYKMDWIHFWRSIFVTDFHFHEYYFHFYTVLLPTFMSIFYYKYSCWNVSSKLCKTAPSEIILSHYIPAAGGMNALWPKLSTSSERIFIKYILIVIKNGSENSHRYLSKNCDQRSCEFSFSFTQHVHANV